MSKYTYRVKIEKYKRGRFEAKYHYDVDLYVDGEYSSIYKRTGSFLDSSGYAYTLKRAKKKALKCVLAVEDGKDEYQVFFDGTGTAKSLEKKLGE